MSLLKMPVIVAACLLAAPALAAEGEQPSTWMTSSTATRAEVRAEMNGATAGEASYTVVPSSGGSAIERARIVAETREMVRLGLHPKHDSNRSATAADLERIRQAGLRAAESRIAAIQ